MDINYKYYDPTGGLIYVCGDPREVYDRLSRDLIAKNYNKCTYIKRITRRQNYDGTISIIVKHDDGFKTVYTIKD